MADIDGLDTRLALIEQRQDLEGKTTEARYHALEKSIDALGADVRASADKVQGMMAEPAGSPAGRALVGGLSDVKGDLAATDKRVADHEAILQQAAGAVRLAKFALGTSLLANALVVIGWLTSVKAVGP